jgi:hypothetical protein
MLIKAHCLRVSTPRCRRSESGSAGARGLPIQRASAAQSGSRITKADDGEAEIIGAAVDARAVAIVVIVVIVAIAAPQERKAVAAVVENHRAS